MALIEWVKHRLRKWLLADADAAFSVGIREMTGLDPRRLDLYHLATRHASLTGLPGKSPQESNERLEFLGDAVLGLVVAERLYEAFPDRQEGFLTELRSKIVNGESLGHLAQKIGLADLIRYEGRRKTNMTHRSMHGDALEALVGAVYLDHGYEPCRRFILDRLIKPHYDLEALAQEESNPKSGILQWAQQNAVHLRFEITHAEGKSHQRTFTATVTLNGLTIVTGQGYSKKKAEQSAAALALEMIQRGTLPPLPKRPERTPPPSPADPEQPTDQVETFPLDSIIDEETQRDEPTIDQQGDPSMFDEEPVATPDTQELVADDESPDSQVTFESRSLSIESEDIEGMRVTSVTSSSTVTTVGPAPQDGQEGDPTMAGLLDDAYAWLLAQESPTGLLLTEPTEASPEPPPDMVPSSEGIEVSANDVASSEERESSLDRAAPTS